MSVRCAGCGGDGVAESGLELAANADSDEVALTLQRCARCQTRFIALYEESRRGRMDHETYRHQVVADDPALVSAIARQFARCPEPRRASCACPVHRAFNKDQSLAQACAELEAAAVPPRPAAVAAPEPSRLWLLGGAAVFVACTLWMVRTGNDRRWFGLFFAPPLVALGLRLALLSRPDGRLATRAETTTTWVLFGFALLAGAFSVWRWG